MQGLILAAGFGSRLKPLTDNIPKAMVLFKGKPLLFHIITKFIKYGIKDIYINTYYKSEKIEKYIQSSNFKAEITLLHEKELSGTGGAIKNMKQYCNTDFLLIYNVDIISDINLELLINKHKQNENLATMVVQNKETQNQIIIDEYNLVRGINYTKENKKIMPQKPTGKVKHMLFCGIHIVNLEIFEYFSNFNGLFSIIPVYIEALKNNKKISAFILKNDIYWKDVGTIIDLENAEKEK